MVSHVKVTVSVFPLSLSFTSNSRYHHEHTQHTESYNHHQLMVHLVFSANTKMNYNTCRHE